MGCLVFREGRLWNSGSMAFLKRILQQMTAPPLPEGAFSDIPCHVNAFVMRLNVFFFS